MLLATAAFVRDFTRTPHRPAREINFHRRAIHMTAAGWMPRAATECWRPTFDDVDRISWGKPAKRKGTGSRGVPHRLNSEERVLFDLARNKGFAEIAGSGWRSQRSDAPLVNTYRNWCDACGVCAIYVHKALDVDTVILDLSPLRVPREFKVAAEFCLAQPEAQFGRLEGIFQGAEVDAENLSVRSSEEETSSEESCRQDSFSVVSGSEAILEARADDYSSEPIHRLPMYVVSWHLPRPEAKKLAKYLAELLQTTATKKGRVKGLGGPRVKPGKARRHGGYGIG